MREERVDCRLMMSQSALLSTSSTKDEFGMDGAMKAAMASTAKSSAQPMPR